MIESIAIEKTDRAFFPEAYAYKSFFEDAGIRCDFIKPFDKKVGDYDALMVFHGFHPFWRRYPRYVIGEYHTLSTGRFPRLKDFLKRVFNKQANINIFLNPYVRKKMWFSSGPCCLYRRMGVPLNDYNKLSLNGKKFDIVYAGSWRQGVEGVINHLAALGFNIAVAGFDFQSANPNVKSFGIVQPSRARDIIGQARYGLNFTPDIHPLNVQDSTKVIEYCAAGLGVITNRYKWINDFEFERNAKFLDLTVIDSVESVHEFDFVVPDVHDLDWNLVIKSSGIMAALERL